MSQHMDGLLYVVQVRKSDSRVTATMHGRPSGQKDCRATWSWDHSLNYDENMDQAAIAVLRRFIDRSTAGRDGIFDARILGGASAAENETTYLVEVYPAEVAAS